MDCIDYVVRTYRMDDWLIDVVPTSEPGIYEYYLQKKGYGFKLLMVGTSGEDHEEIILSIIDEYTEIYNDQIGFDEE